MPDTIICVLGKTVTISRGCRQSAFAGAVAGNGVGVSTSSQSCSTDLCNTGDGLGPSINFPGFNANNGFGFSSGSNTNFHSSAPGGMNCNAQSPFHSFCQAFNNLDFNFFNR